MRNVVDEVAKVLAGIAVAVDAGGGLGGVKVALVLDCREDDLSVSNNSLYRADRVE